MERVLWERLESLFHAAGLGLLSALGAGLILVPYFRRRRFVSRESKEGVKAGQTDQVPMGGGFILLVGVSAAVVVLTLFEQIRRGFTGCFLIALWGFALLGYLDDRSKARATGYSDRAKIILQVAVTGLFAASFTWYARSVAKVPDVGLVALPFVGHVSLGYLYVPFIMLFLFWVSNAVNITDGFDGLSGGVGAVIAVGYAAVCFLIGASELQRLATGELAGPTGEVQRRMFALSLISASLAGSLVAYLYFNWRRGLVYFGDTGSMALGAAVAFLALFSRTEFLLLVIGGVTFIEAASAAIQRLATTLQKRFLDPRLQARGEPWRPFVMAPLHHHFEHLQLRELEGSGLAPAAARRLVRRRLTVAAWILGAVFALLGIAAQYGHYRERDELYDWACVAALLLIIGVLVHGVMTRLLADSYFLAPDDDGTVSLRRGLPLRLGSRRMHRRYAATDLPIETLGHLGRMNGLYRQLATRVDARLALGLVLFEAGESSEEPERSRRFGEALSYWEAIPLGRLLLPERQPHLEQMATCYATLGRHADAVRVLEALASGARRPEIAALIEAQQQAALAAAEVAYAAWQPGRGEAERRAALAAHEDLLGLVRRRHDRLRQLRDALAVADPAGAEVVELDAQLGLLGEALAVAEARCERLRP